MRTVDILLEVGTEEIPDRFVADALREIAAGARAILAELGLPFASLATHGTTRRLALVVTGLAARQDDRTEHVVGPPVAAAFKDGRPTRAAEGFAAKMGVSVEELTRVDDAKGERVAAVRSIPGRAAAEVLATDLLGLVRDLHWGKTMRWGSGEHVWVRPVHWLVALAGEEVVPCELFGVRSGRQSRGHRSRHPGPVEVARPSGYLDALRAAFVLGSREERRAAIEEGLAAGASQLGGRLVPDAALVETTVDLVEWPVVLAGRLPADYLELPDVVLSTALRVHQRCFVATGEDGRLLPGFLHVANQEDRDGRITDNNASVIAARLDDARFFWKKDRERTLASRVGDLGRVQVHARLGTYLDKVHRMKALAGELLALEAGAAGRDEGTALLEAVELCKADQVTEMVAELTDLQGQVGGLYLRAEGGDDAVCAAVEEHYLPQSLTDPVPATRLGALLSVVDKADTLAGCFGVGVIPTGSKDPFGLRRAGQGLVRTLLESPVDVSVRALLDAAAEGYSGPNSGAVGFDAGRIEADLVPFLEQRLRFLLSEGVRLAPGGESFAADEVAAVVAASWDRPKDVLARLTALHEVRRAEKRADFEALSVAFKRVRNILRGQERQGLDAARLAEPAEVALAARLAAVRDDVAARRRAGDHRAALEAIASLRPEVDRFFDEVLVMADDAAVRANRLALLQEIEDLFLAEADLSQVVVAGR